VDGKLACSSSDVGRLCGRQKLQHIVLQGTYMYVANVKSTLVVTAGGLVYINRILCDANSISSDSHIYTVSQKNLHP